MNDVEAAEPGEVEPDDIGTDALGDEPSNTEAQPEAPRVPSLPRPADPGDPPVPPPGYTISRLLGAGGQARVWAGTETRTGVAVALKLWPEATTDRDRDRLRREIAVLKQLTGHPNIVRFLNAETSGEGRPWLATELCEESLAARLESRPLTLDEAFVVADGVLTGLAAIHAKGHVHRDVKPANVLLHHGHAKLCDLGLAGEIGTHTSMPHAGTPRYLAPELARSQPTVLSDIYATALTLDDAFHGTGAPAAVDDILTRASSSRPVDRPTSAEELRLRLAALRRPRPGYGPPPRPRPSTTRRGFLAALALVGVVATLVLVTAQTLPGSGGTPSPSPSGPAASGTGAAPEHQIQSLFASKCVDVRGPRTEDGTPLQLWDCINVPEERWRWVGRRLQGFADKCIAVAAGSGSDGTPVELTTCADQPRQSWTLTSDGQLRVFDSMCLDVRGPGTADGTALQIWTCLDVPQQKWRLYS